LIIKFLFIIYHSSFSMSLWDDHRDTVTLTKRYFLDSLLFPAVAALSILLVHAYQQVQDFDPGLYGIMSRRLWGLRGIITGPLIHGSWQHVFSNAVPLFALTFVCLYFYRKVAMQAFWLIYFGTGTAVWFFARPVSHIGASGVVYGLFFFVLCNGIFRRSLRGIMISAIIMLLYSGMFMGLLPNQEGVSWESHLIGGMMGIFAAFTFRNDLEDEEVAEAAERSTASETDTELAYFFPMDVFEKTKVQRRIEAEEEARRQAEELARQQQNPYDPPFWTSTFS
jgi:membrane associated rhomboid family serine protease